MTGIQYATDEKGRKVAVQIDLKEYRELWEDIQDVLVSRSRRHEKRIPLDKVRAGLDQERQALACRTRLTTTAQAE
ncbi:MAG: hypothetical protein ABSC93_03980 [Bryobacteraceae bacterium]|jgi:hypothetical protein